MEIGLFKDGERCVIRMAGRFDAHCKDEFLEMGERALAESAEIQVDLGRVDYLDSTALGLLLLIRDKANGAGKKVTLANARESVKQVLEIAKFTKIFQVWP